MTILLTGATGLVGARLLPRLIAAGHDCRALVRDGKAVTVAAPTMEGDLLDPPSLVPALAGVSTIIHLAAVFRTQDEPLIWRSNLDGSRNLIGAAEAYAPEARFIMASTANIYDKDQARPSREEDAAAPTQAYPASKLAAERVLRGSRLTWAVIRLPFVYGDADGHLEMIPRHAPTAKWHPAMRMSTIHHRDVATGIELALAGAFDGRVVNIADDLPASMIELASLGGGRIDSSAEPLARPWELQVDTALARHLGYYPTVRTVYQAAQQGLL